MTKKRSAGAPRYRPPLTISRRDYLRGGSDAAFREAIYALVQGAGRLLTCREAFGRSLDLTASQFAVLMGVAYRQGRDGVTVGQLSAPHRARAHPCDDGGGAARRARPADQEAERVRPAQRPRFAVACRRKSGGRGCAFRARDQRSLVRRHLGCGSGNHQDRGARLVQKFRSCAARATPAQPRAEPSPTVLSHGALSHWCSTACSSRMIPDTASSASTIRWKVASDTPI